MIEKPSKTFLIRGGVAFGILILIFVFQTNIFQNRFSKKDHVTQKNIESLEELIKKDSNENGIPDWEERFWGLDPLVTSTNGRLHTEIIAERKTILSSQTNAEKLTETDRVARELFMISTIVGGSTDGDLGTIRAVSLEAADAFTQGKGLIDQITIDTMELVPTDKNQIALYMKKLIEVLESKTPTNELEVMALVSENNDMSLLPKLTPITASYKELSRKVISIPVPRVFAEDHLALANSINNMGRGLATFQTIKDDPLIGIIGFYQYNTESDRFSDTVDTILEKINPYFIIE
jgi:hypothetical protein